MVKTRPVKTSVQMTIAERLASYGPVHSNDFVLELAEATRQQKIKNEIDRRLNAWPVLDQKATVRSSVRGWRYIDCRVVRDDGPAKDGERAIVIEKITGPRAGERLNTRRDRVWVVADNAG